MTTLLQIDASPRAGTSDTDRYGSHTRRLTARFMARWRQSRPGDTVVHRDVGMNPPSLVDGRWIHAAFTAPPEREPWMRDVLAESDALIDELVAADVVVAGVPMYNFNVPAQFKAYIDNVVRVGRTFGFDRSRPGEPYWPMLAGQDRRLVILSARGDFGYGTLGRLGHLNHADPSIATVFRWIGIDDIEAIAVEYDEYADDRLAASIARAEAEVDALVDRLVAAPPVLRSVA